MNTVLIHLPRKQQCNIALIHLPRTQQCNIALIIPISTNKQCKKHKHLKIVHQLKTIEADIHNTIDVFEQNRMYPVNDIKILLNWQKV